MCKQSEPLPKPQPQGSFLRLPCHPCYPPCTAIVFHGHQRIMDRTQKAHYRAPHQHYQCPLRCISVVHSIFS